MGKISGRKKQSFVSMNEPQHHVARKEADESCECGVVAQQEVNGGGGCATAMTYIRRWCEPDAAQGVPVDVLWGSIIEGGEWVSV